MFTPDRSGNPEMVHELLKSLDEVTKQIKFRPLALIWKPFRRLNPTASVTRPVAVRRTAVVSEEC